MQKDPLMYVDGMNDYSYVGNMPVSFLDSYGYAGEAFIAGKFGSMTQQMIRMKLAQQAMQNAVNPAVNQQLSGQIYQYNSKAIISGNMAGTLGKGSGVWADDGKVKTPGKGQMIGELAGSIIGSAIAGAVIGATAGGVGAVPGFFIGLGSGLVGGWVGGKIGKQFDKEDDSQPLTCEP